MTTKNQCCIACEARHGGHKWCKKPTCKCHTPKEETVEEIIDDIVYSSAFSYAERETSGAEEQKQMLREFANILQQSALEEKKELVKSLVEPVAKAIYDQMSYYEDGAKPEWVESGNSLKQDEARTLALKALAERHNINIK